MKRKKRQILSFVLALAMVFGQMSGMSLTALADGATTNSSWNVNDDGTLSLSATAAEKAIGNITDNTIKMVLIGTLGGEISHLPAASEKVTTKISSDGTAAMILYDDAQSNESIKSTLMDIRFSDTITQVHIDVTTGQTTDSIRDDIQATTNVTFGILNSNGEAHAYKYIAGEVDWITAYSKAVGGEETLGGLKGYLATVTTKEEANILNNFYKAVTDSNQGAWIAGTSLRYSTEDSVNYDQAKPIAPDNYSASSAASVVDLKINANVGAYYCPLNGSSTTADVYGPYYYWACGPEWGDRVPSGLWASGEPNNSDSGKKGEYCAVSSWSRNATFNDLSPFNEAGGYFLEFSVYAGGIATGVAYNSVTIYKVTYDGNGATEGTVPAPQEKFGDADLTLAVNTGALEIAGYTLSGWNTEADGSGTDYVEGGTYSNNEAVTLYAKWMPIATAATVSPNSRTYDGTTKPLVTVADDAVGGTMQYALGDNAETAPDKGWSTSIPEGTDAGTYYVWYKVVADGNYTDSEAACVVSKIRTVISKTVTFKVINGSWNDGESKDVTVKLSGYEGDTLKLSVSQIPAVGNKPGANYQAGSWDVTPGADTAITADTTYTYTYAAKAAEKGKLTVIAKDQTISYGNPIKTDVSAYEITGLANGDNAMVTLKADVTACTITPSVTVKNGDKDVTANYEINATLGKLRVKGVPMIKAISKGKGITLSWDKVKNADGYDIYAAYCGSTAKLIKTVKGNKTLEYTYKKLDGKKLNLKKSSKVYVKAYRMVDGKKVILKSSITAHVAGVNNKKKTNAKSITLTKSKYTLSKGKTANVKAKITLVSNKKKQLSEGHAAALRYASSDKTVATVSSSGKITAVGSGTCSIYVYAVNGAHKKVTVKVK